MRFSGCLYAVSVASAVVDPYPPDNSVTRTLYSASCSKNVPTMPEWAMIIMGLLLLTVMMKRHVYKS